MLGCLFSFLLVRACPAALTAPSLGPGQPGSSASLLPFRIQNYLGLLLSGLFSCANVLEKAKQSEMETRSATGFPFPPPPRVERDLE